MLHCLHNTLLSISRERGTGDLICNSLQPKAELLVFPGFPFTYSTRWHLRPDGALTFSIAEQVVLLLLHLLLNTLCIDKGKGSSNCLRRQAKLRYGLRVKDQGQISGSMPTTRRLRTEFTYPDIARDGSKNSFSKSYVTTALSILYITASTHMD